MGKLGLYREDNISSFETGGDGCGDRLRHGGVEVGDWELRNPCVLASVFPVGWRQGQSSTENGLR